jgi:hypothetical protein
MEKEKWIEEVFESTKGMRKLEASPFLFEQVSARVNKQEPRLSIGIKWAMGFTAALFLTINILSVGQATDFKHQAAAKTASQQEFNYITVYSY